MNKKHVAVYAAVAAMFGIMGALVAINKKDPPPITTTIAPTGGKAHTAVDNLFAQSLNDLQGTPQQPGARPACRRCRNCPNWRVPMAARPSM
jgi:hypothetical protein